MGNNHSNAAVLVASLAMVHATTTNAVAFAPGPVRRVASSANSRTFGIVSPPYESKSTTEHAHHNNMWPLFSSLVDAGVKVDTKASGGEERRRVLITPPPPAVEAAVEAASTDIDGNRRVLVTPPPPTLGAEPDTDMDDDDDKMEADAAAFVEKMLARKSGQGAAAPAPAQQQGEEVEQQDPPQDLRAGSKQQQEQDLEQPFVVADGACDNLVDTVAAFSRGADEERTKLKLEEEEEEKEGEMARLANDETKIIEESRMAREQGQLGERFQIVDNEDGLSEQVLAEESVGREAERIADKVRLSEEDRLAREEASIVVEEKVVTAEATPPSLVGKAAERLAEEDVRLAEERRLAEELRLAEEHHHRPKATREEEEEAVRLAFEDNLSKNAERIREGIMAEVYARLAEFDDTATVKKSEPETTAAEMVKADLAVSAATAQPDEKFQRSLLAARLEFEAEERERAQRKKEKQQQPDLIDHSSVIEDAIAISAQPASAEHILPNVESVADADEEDDMTNGKDQAIQVPEEMLDEPRWSVEEADAVTNEVIPSTTRIIETPVSEHEDEEEEKAATSTDRVVVTAEQVAILKPVLSSKNKPRTSFWRTVNPSEVTSSIITTLSPEKGVLQLKAESETEIVRAALSHLAKATFDGSRAAVFALGAALETVRNPEAAEPFQIAVSKARDAARSVSDGSDDSAQRALGAAGAFGDATVTLLRLLGSVGAARSAAEATAQSTHQFSSFVAACAALGWKQGGRAREYVETVKDEKVLAQKKAEDEKVIAQKKAEEERIAEELRRKVEEERIAAEARAMEEIKLRVEAEKRRIDGEQAAAEERALEEIRRNAEAEKERLERERLEAFEMVRRQGGKGVIKINTSPRDSTTRRGKKSEPALFFADE